jgi:hypothetical protein
LSRLKQAQGRRALQRRDLSKGERAMSIALLYPDGGKPAPGRKDPAATEAETASVSMRRVKEARQVLRHGAPELARAVRDGHRKLVEVKERVGHGRYTAFVTERLGWSMRSGQNFVSVFEMIKSANFAPLGTMTIDASSLYLLAAPSTPEEVREQVLEKAATPEGISRAEVEELVKEAVKAAREKFASANFAPDESARLADLPITGEALYLLSGPSVPEEVREEAVGEAPRYHFA